jgi:hypothetical protein
MSHSDWRSTAAYDRPGFAWEYVRRNPGYHRDCRELAHSKPDSHDHSVQEEMGPLLL